MVASAPVQGSGGVQFSHRLLNTATENPYDAFTAPQFDSWVGDLTSTIRAALNNKSRGKARDPRDGAGLEGLRRELALSRSSDVFDSPANGEPGESSSFALTPLSDVVHLDDEQDEQEQEEEEQEEEDEAERVAERTSEEVVDVRPELPRSPSEDNEHEELDLDEIYRPNGAARSETRGSPPWEFQEEFNEGESEEIADFQTAVHEEEEYDDTAPYTEDLFGDDFDDDSKEPDVKAYNREKLSPEVFEIVDDDDEEGEEVPVPKQLSTSDNEDIEDELAEEDKENVAVSSFSRQFSAHFSAQVPVSSARDGTPSPRPDTLSPPKSQEIISIDEDEDLPALPMATVPSERTVDTNAIDLFAFPDDIVSGDTSPRLDEVHAAFEVVLNPTPVSILDSVLPNLPNDVQHIFSEEDAHLHASMFTGIPAAALDVEALIATAAPDVAQILAAFPLHGSQSEVVDLSVSVDATTSIESADTVQSSSWITVEETESALDVEPVTEVDAAKVVGPPTQSEPQESADFLMEEPGPIEELPVDTIITPQSPLLQSEAEPPIEILNVDFNTRESPIPAAEITTSAGAAHTPAFESSGVPEERNGTEPGDVDMGSASREVLSVDEVQEINVQVAHSENTPEVARIPLDEEVLFQHTNASSMTGDNAATNRSETAHVENLIVQSDANETDSIIVSMTPTATNSTNPSAVDLSSSEVEASTEFKPIPEDTLTEVQQEGTPLTPGDKISQHPTESHISPALSTEDHAVAVISDISIIVPADMSPALDTANKPVEPTMSPTTQELPRSSTQDTQSNNTYINVDDPDIDYSILPTAMQEVLGLPSPVDASASLAPIPSMGEEEQVSSQESGANKTRKAKNGRLAVPTRSSARLARTQSQPGPMSPPMARSRPPRSVGSEASSVSSSADGSFSRESSVASTRGRRRKRDDESAAGSRESTVQPSSTKTTNQHKKRKINVEANEQTVERSETTGELPTTRPPLLRTQTYRHYHGKRNGTGTEPRPTWASLKSLLKPTLALLRAKPGESSSSSTPDSQASESQSQSHAADVDDVEVAPKAEVHLHDSVVAHTAETTPNREPDEAPLEVPQISTGVPPQVEEESVRTPENHVADVADDRAPDPITSTQSLFERAIPMLAVNTSLESNNRPLNSGLESPAIPSVPPPTPAMRTSSHARRPSFIIQDSVPESGHMTRSNCRFHKISIPKASGSQEVVQFLAPACSITNRELMHEEGIIDCGVATNADHDRTIIELELVPDDVLHTLRLLVGLELLRDGEVGFLVPYGKSIETLRLQMPDTSHSIFHQYKKAVTSTIGEAVRTTPLKRRKRKRAVSEARSNASSLTELESDREARLNETHDALDSPTSRTRSHGGAVGSSPTHSPDFRRRSRARLEDDEIEYKPTDADRELEAEDDQEDYDELLLRPKKRGRNKTVTSAASSESAPSPAPAAEAQIDSSVGDASLLGSQNKQKRAPRRKVRRRKGGVVDPGFKPELEQPSSDDDAETTEKKSVTGKRGKKRDTGEEASEVTEDVVAPAVKKRRTGL